MFGAFRPCEVNEGDTVVVELKHDLVLGYGFGDDRPLLARQLVYGWQLTQEFPGEDICLGATVAEILEVLGELVRGEPLHEEIVQASAVRLTQVGHADLPLPWRAVGPRMMGLGRPDCRPPGGMIVLLLWLGCSGARVLSAARCARRSCLRGWEWRRLMRKRVLSSTQDAADAAVDWLYLEPLVEVEITSEDPAWPVESALLPGGGPGWRAAGAGSQTIRLVFDAPQSLHRIRLEFRETKTERTQEYVIRWSADGGQEFREVIRQRWNFSPGGSTHQVEDHAVDLPGVTVLELDITPDIGGGSAPASLHKLRLA